MENYASRMVPRKVFESFTPMEIALRRATVENDMWVQQMDRLVRERAGRRLALTRLDEMFGDFINVKFPIEVVDVDGFVRFVLEKEIRRPVERTSAQDPTWWSSNPRGQKFHAYPLVDEPPEEDMLRRR